MIVIPRSLVRIQLERYAEHCIFLVEWPSGLRRQVKALISSEARVRIPSEPKIYFFFFTRIRVHRISTSKLNCVIAYEDQYAASSLKKITYHAFTYQPMSPLSSEGRALAF